VNAVAAMESEGIKRITFTAIAKRLKVHPEQVKRRAARAIGQGWIINKEERKNHPARLTVEDADPLPIKTGLPDPRLIVPDTCETVKGDNDCNETNEKSSDNSIYCETFTGENTASQYPNGECETVNGCVKDAEPDEKIDESDGSGSLRSDDFTVSQQHCTPNGHDGDGLDWANGVQHDTDAVGCAAGRHKNRPCSKEGGSTVNVTNDGIAIAKRELPGAQVVAVNKPLFCRHCDRLLAVNYTRAYDSGRPVVELLALL